MESREYPFAVNRLQYKSKTQLIYQVQLHESLSDLLRSAFSFGSCSRAIVHLPCSKMVASSVFAAVDFCSTVIFHTD